MPALPSFKPPPPWAYFAASALPEGLRRGAVTALSGAWGGGKTQLVSQILAENTDTAAAWIETAWSLYPAALVQSGVALSRLLCVRAQDQKQGLWAAHHALKSQVFGIVVLYCEATPALKDIALRRLQLAAEKSHSALIILSEKPLTQTWMLALQCHVQRGQGDALQVTVLRGSTFAKHEQAYARQANES